MTPSLRSAYDHCRKIALGHYENFPVGSLLLPKKVRHHVYALYAFMRTADDFADVADRPREKRLALLADWREQLRASLHSVTPANPIFLALQNTIGQCSIDPDLLFSLLDAFEFDAKGEVSFPLFSDLRWYTARSAEPVGRLMLALFGYRDAERIDWSNEICTALQLINFLQDAKEDLEHGRIYFPLSEAKSLGLLTPKDFLTSNKTASLVLRECDRIEKLLDFGAPLPESVTGRFKYELRATVLGARMMLKKIRAAKGDTIRKRPLLSIREKRAVLLGAIVGGKIK